MITAEHAAKVTIYPSAPELAHLPLGSAPSRQRPRRNPPRTGTPDRPHGGAGLSASAGGGAPDSHRRRGEEQRDRGRAAGPETSPVIDRAASRHGRRRR